MKNSKPFFAITTLVTAILASAGTAQAQNKVCYEVAQGSFGSPSYLDATLQTHLGPTLYDAWCVDTDRRFEENTTYTGVLVELGDPAIVGLIEHPENLDLVVYILNQGYAGKASPNGLGTYTYGDVQRAIWTLVEDALSVRGLGAYSQARVAEIVAFATESGQGFVPLCGQTTIQVINAVQLGCDPGTELTESIAQVTILEVPVTCATNPGTGTPGYWKNHAEAWPVEAINVGGVSYTQAEAIAWLTAPVRQDKRVTIYASLLSAKLNVLIGNDSSCIQAIIDAADAWWALYSGSQVRANSVAWRLGEPLHRELDAYNNGQLCAPHRD